MAGFWGLNAGLMGMVMITLVPVGALQAIESFDNGFWSARSWEFYQRPVVNLLLWLRMIPDTVFIVAGVLPVVAASVYGLFNMRREVPLEVNESVPELSPERTVASAGVIYRSRL
jgi:nitric oxide reductase subunit B